MTKRIPYHALVSFNTPQQGTILVAAEDIEHCKKLLAEQFADVENFKIHDIYPANLVKYDDPPTKEALDFDEITKGKLN